MTNRADLLRSLLRFDRPLSDLSAPLARFGWDSDRELATIERAHVLAILGRYLSGEIQPPDVEDWANAIEGREDIGYERGHEDGLREVVYELANPYLTRPLSVQSAKELMSCLSLGISPAAV